MFVTVFAWGLSMVGYVCLELVQYIRFPQSCTICKPCEKGTNFQTCTGVLQLLPVFCRMLAVVSQLLIACPLERLVHG